MGKDEATFGLFLMVTLLGAGSVCAQDHAQHTPTGSASIGQVVMEISCRPDARAPFLEGVAHLHSFSFQAARQAFQQAAKVDPACAMAYWGEAISYYDFLFQPPAEKDLESALQAIEKARLAETQTDRERGYVDAVRTLFLDFPRPSRLHRDVAYSEAMEQLSRTYPEDDEAAIFFALSLLAQGRRGVPNPGQLQMRAAEILEPRLQKLPEHPGIAHYLIHAYDDSGLRSKGVAAAERYAKIAPAVTHALHMPSHIFAGMGMWDGMIESNKAALATAPFYYHALTWMVYAHLQKGQFQQAKALVDEHREKAIAKEDNRAERSALLDMDVWLRLETRDWKNAAQEPAYWDGPLEKAAALYIRGMGAARLGNQEAAVSSLKELQDIVAKLGAYDDAAIALRAKMATVQAKQIEAAIHLSNKRGEEAIALLKEACEIDEAPGISWLRPDSGTPVPSRELLGELLLELQRPREAVEQFEIALRSVPRRLRSLHGLAKASALTGDRRNAEVHYRNLLELLSGADADLPELAEARRYLTGGQPGRPE